LIYKDGTDYKIWRGAYDSEPSRATPNHFTAVVPATVDCQDTTGNYLGTTINLATISPKDSTTRIALRLRPFYNEADVRVVPLSGENLPAQGKIITATGTAGDTTRRVSVTQSFPSLPAIFDYALFSGTDINKSSSP
jgi:hypothetical protein